MLISPVGRPWSSFSFAFVSSYLVQLLDNNVFSIGPSSPDTESPSKEDNDDDLNGVVNAKKSEEDKNTRSASSLNTLRTFNIRPHKVESSEEAFPAQDSGSQGPIL